MTASDRLFTTHRSAFLDELQQWGPVLEDGKIRRCDNSPSLKEAEKYCKQLALRHYENFSIASFFVPASLRQDLYHVYAYCRWSDDLSDEIDSDALSLQYLEWWEGELRSCLDTPSCHPVMVAIASTIQKHKLSLTPFLDLLDAFRQDQVQKRYSTGEELLEYCRRSANPVGRILLQMAGVTSSECLDWSDSICTGLQIANFCQDISRDARLGRIYLPKNYWGRWGLTESELLDDSVSPSKRRMLKDWVEEARLHLESGRALASHTPAWLNRDVRLFVGGGLAILDAIAESDFDVWSQRVEVTKWKKVRLLLGESISKGMVRESAILQNSDRYAERVARNSGSNFFRSFGLLRAEKKSAMMALYAFARLVDDVSDGDPDCMATPNQAFDGSQDGRQDELQQWHAWVEGLKQGEREKERGWVGAGEGGMQRKLLWPAMSEAVHRFGIPLEHLHGIVTGSESDLEGKVRFADEEAVRGYFYQVASTVGLCCLSIWRGDLMRVQEAAIECGMAFQRTNVLRDLREDADRGRLYLPLDEVQAYGVDVDAWMAGSPNGDWVGLVQSQVAKAKSSFDKGREVLHHIEPDGQRMFSLMWSTYRLLLQRIESDIPRAWEHRVSLTKREKLRLVGSHWISPWYLMTHGRRSRS